MAEYSFNALKSNEKAFVAMTSLNVKEFLGLLERFSAAYQTDLHARGKRVDETRGRSDGKLALIELNSRDIPPKPSMMLGSSLTELLF
ncbi:MAG: hypothetical protein QJT81_01925 [Candidatus Thiothrix putei]|uniref:Uncharacterized protein n=1 Tax=Candidatus Thiothrix putei TaxID=3080811 RepID=A0AA95HCJ1_9GAMM|nr:MAG: hypothetical protein QJT81_01925 [Candidatus Thiothrix putei]